MNKYDSDRTDRIKSIIKACWKRAFGRNDKNYNDR